MRARFHQLIGALTVRRPLFGREICLFLFHPDRHRAPFAGILLLSRRGLKLVCLVIATRLQRTACRRPLGLAGPPSTLTFGRIVPKYFVLVSN